MKCLGLDLSLTAPGLVVLAKEKGSKIVDTVVAEQIPVAKASEGNRWDRIVMIGDHVASIVDAHKPSVVVIEGYGQVSHGGVQSFVKQVEAGTIVRLVLWGNDLEWMEVPPTSLKAFTLFKGDPRTGLASKKAMCAAVKRRWGYETKNHNIADAFSLAAFGLAAKGIVPCLPAQWDTIGKVSGAL